MERTKIILSMLFILTLGSGVVAGMLVAKMPAKTATAVQRSAIGDALSLDKQQEEKVKSIWDEIGSNVDDCYLRVQRIQSKRDELVFKMLTDEQKQNYNEIQKETQSALAALKKERGETFADAVARTKAILNGDQVKKYDQILSARLGSSSTQDWIGAKP